jgi:hypothetical protein
MTKRPYSITVASQTKSNAGSHCLHNAKLSVPRTASVQELEAAIRELIALHNRQPKPFLWTKSADQILASIARFATATLAAQSHTTYTRNQ